MRALSTVRADPRALALARIGVGTGALLNIIEAYFHLMQIATEGRIAMPTVAGLPSVTTTSAGLFLALTAPAAIAVILGVFVPVMAPWVTLTTFAVIGWEQQTYSNHYILVAWLCLWLSFARSDQAWALGADSRRPRATTLDRQVLLMTQLSVCYLFAALAKLNSHFLSGDVLRGVMTLALPHGIYPVLAVATVLTELSLAVGLWLPIVRWPAALCGLGLHLVIPLTIANPYPLVSFSVTCLALYPLFLSRPSRVGRSGRDAQMPARRPFERVGGQIGTA